MNFAQNGDAWAIGGLIVAVISLLVIVAILYRSSRVRRALDDRDSGFLASIADPQHTSGPGGLAGKAAE